jgi:FkbM family methyltransferase
MLEGLAKGLKAVGARLVAGGPPSADPKTSHGYTERRPGPYQAQHGEDRWLESHFADVKAGFFVEVGAYDGVVLSNTYLLESLGWTGILVEPDVHKARKCRENRPACRVFECAAVATSDIEEVTFHAVDGGEVYSTAGELTEDQAKRLQTWGLQPRRTTVRARTLDSMLEEVAPARVDFVSIDVEGGELEVLRGFDLARWRPRVVMVEVNSRFRSSAIRDAFTRSGYVYLTSISINDIYVPLTQFHGVAAALDRLRYGSRASRRIVDALKVRASRLVGRPVGPRSA